MELFWGFFDCALVLKVLLNDWLPNRSLLYNITEFVLLFVRED
jgi:hypothetical protein